MVAWFTCQELPKKKQSTFIAELPQGEFGTGIVLCPFSSMYSQGVKPVNGINK
jgi:hypothetical protein